MSIVFRLGGLMFYFVFYQSKLIPRWISVWGFIGVRLYFVSGMLMMFDLITPTINDVLQLPHIGTRNGSGGMADR